MEKEKLCLRCMRKIGDSNVCPYCRNESAAPQKNPYLPLKTVVGGRYLVGKLVSENSEGFTYYAFDLERKTPVTLRELFPKDILSRGEGNYCLVNVGKAADFIDIKEEFVKLWKKLSSLSGYTALIHIDGLVEDLGTVYSVSEYLGEGQTLRDYLLKKEQGYISWDEARVLFMPVLSALGELHSAGIIHGGISPETLVLDKNGKLKITGYSIESVRRQKTKTECEIFDGYAAVEQYGFSGELSPSTDIYAFAAVLYRSLIGSTPMSAASRLTNDKLMIPGKFAEQLPAYVINALVNALQILPDDRTPNAEQLRDDLSASPAAAGTASEALSSVYESHENKEKEYRKEEIPTPEPVSEDDEDDEPDANKINKSTIAAFVVSVIICLAVIAFFLWGFKGCSGDDGDTTTESTSVEDTSEITETADAGVVSMSVPNFVGKMYDDIKDDENYNRALDIKTEYQEDKDFDKGAIISQSLPAGTSVTSLDPRTITLTVSSGIEVPSVEGKDMNTAINELKDKGFKNVESRVGHIAGSEADSQKVYSVVCEDEDGNWSAIPNDRHLSASDSIVVYYYGEYTPETVAEDDTGSETDSADNGYAY